MKNLLRIKRLHDQDQQFSKFHKGTLPDINEILYDLNHYIIGIENESGEGDEEIILGAGLTARYKNRYYNRHQGLTLFSFPVYDEPIKYLIKIGDYWANLGSEPIKIRRSHPTREQIDNQELCLGELNRAIIYEYFLFRKNPFKHEKEYEWELKILKGEACSRWLL